MGITKTIKQGEKLEIMFKPILNQETGETSAAVLSVSDPTLRAGVEKGMILTKVGGFPVGDCGFVVAFTKLKEGLSNRPVDLEFAHPQQSAGGGRKIRKSQRKKTYKKRNKSKRKKRRKTKRK